jgi:hypothetical protein
VKEFLLAIRGHRFLNYSSRSRVSWKVASVLRGIIVRAGGTNFAARRATDLRLCEVCKSSVKNRYGRDYAQDTPTLQSQSWQPVDAICGTWTMTYTDAQFGQDLLAELTRGYDPGRIAEWAYAIFMDADRRDRSHEVHHALIDLFTMGEGSEFHIPEQELRVRAVSFITGK